MPGSTPATSQLDWLISITAMIVLFWSRATRDLLKACPGAGRGRSAGASRHSIGYMQRRSCHFLAARPIALSVPPRWRTTGHAGASDRTACRRDQGLESPLLQQPVCLSSERRGCKRKAPHFGGGLRVAGDVRRDVQAAEPGLLRPFSLTGIDAVPPPEGSDRLQNDARPRWGGGLGNSCPKLRFSLRAVCVARSSPAADRVRSAASQ